MLPYFNQIYGNPHARSHQDGWSANDALEIARLQVIKLLMQQKRKKSYSHLGLQNQIILPSKAWKIFGKNKNHIIIKMEHKCMFEAIQSMEREGFTVTYLDMNEQVY